LLRLTACVAFIHRIPAAASGILVAARCIRWSGVRDRAVVKRKMTPRIATFRSQPTAM
jgi:hypothetical protein